MATYLLNLLPSTAINNEIPFSKLFHKEPDYSRLRIFGCLCYPHLHSPHKLAPRATPCIFLGYPAYHRGYRCLDLETNKIILSRHVTFDETQFPYKSMTPSSPPSYTFLDTTPASPILHHILNAKTQQPHIQTQPNSNQQPNNPLPNTGPPMQAQQPQNHTGPSTNAHELPIHNPTTHPPYDPPTNHSSHVPEPTRTHRMVTRSQAGIVKPIDRLSLHTSPLSPIPKSPFLALKDPNWSNAMHDEYNALVKNGTWILVPRPSNVNLVRSMWLFKHKFHADGTLSRYKARLVANGSSQQLGVDFDETFSPVVKPATIRTVLSLVVSRRWPIHQLEKRCFLNGDFNRKRSLYGQKQAPCAWFQRFAGYATRAGFSPSRCDSSLFIYTQGFAVDPDSNWVRTVSSSEDPTLYHSLAGGTSSILPLLAHICPMQFNIFVSICMIRGSRILPLSNVSYAIAEAEYRGVANVVTETAWIRNLLRELHFPLLTATLVYCDNVSAAYMSANPVQHQRTKHIEIDIHFVRDMVKAGHVRILHVPSRFQYADIFTKGLPSALFKDFRSNCSNCGGVLVIYFWILAVYKSSQDSSFNGQVNIQSQVINQHLLLIDLY
ncbi:ribonuclease H-like domain-containing protein [Tanacetum coccineum]|uniref:Ribonuclease H-like domain-containing protein n=1 Tax=Tanacetum coccineum TaxID=301880 RepID=A0ABQ5B121_9ASTR